MFTRKSYSFAIVSVLLVAGFYLLSCGKEAMAGPVQLKMISALVRGTTHDHAADYFVDAVKEKSNGDLAIKVIGGPEVIGAFDQVKAIKNGVVDISYIYAAAYENIVPIDSALLLSKNSAAEQRKNGFYDYVNKLHNKAGLVYLGRVYNRELGMPKMFYIYTNKPVKTPQELSGQLVGCPSPALNAFLTAIGMKPVGINYSEAYIALNTKVVDAYWTTHEFLKDMALSEVVKYWINPAVYSNNMVFVMSLKVWKKLSPHLQKVLIDSAIKVENDLATWYTDRTKDYERKLRDAGLKPIIFSPKDEKWLTDVAYGSKWKEIFKRYPDIAPKLKKLGEG